MNNLSVEKFRKYFPYLNNGIIYFNHASTGPVPSTTAARLKSIIEVKSNECPDDYQSFLKVMTETKEDLGRLVNCSPDRIAFLDNTTNGLNLLALGIEWKKGDRILLNDVEFPANVYPFLNLKRFGVEVDFIRAESGFVTAEQIIDSVKPETKLISVSFVQFISGYKINLEKLGNYCRNNNIIFCVDAIQGIGAVAIDVTKSKIDYLSCGTQKWLLGMQGLAFIYVDENLQRKMIPANLGWLSVENAWDLLNYDVTPKSTASVFQGGTLNLLGIYAFNSSLKIFHDFGVVNVEKEILKNSRYFISALKKIGVESVLSNCSDDELAGIVTVKLNSADRVVAELQKKKIFCSLREGQIRFSPHFYNIIQEINTVVDELKKL
ncbi:MAG: aminotransferase class V-fold PLP-dependent enzyme [Ignavibacteriaceae bacterium]|nr:aminotransferase class V-fold PLP-dependent enzyme [Ignavibacteriaceae bacterium]